jgi:hypothetical protein
MEAPEKQMSLPPRQQMVLDQIERILQAADPRLKSMFASFARLAARDDMPATEAISGRSARRTALVSVVVLGMLGTIMFNVLSTSRDCPGLPSDQVVASAAVRYAACSHSTNAWSKGAR